MNPDDREESAHEEYMREKAERKAESDDFERLHADYVKVVDENTSLRHQLEMARDKAVEAALDEARRERDEAVNELAALVDRLGSESGAVSDWGARKPTVQQWGNAVFFAAQYLVEREATRVGDAHSALREADRFIYALLQNESLSAQTVEWCEDLWQKIKNSGCIL